MANVTITQLPAADTLTGAELVPVVQNGVTVQTTTADIAASPSLTQTFLTVTNAPSLANSRYFSVGTGLGLTDNGAQSNLVLNLNGTSGSLELAGNGVIVKTASNTITARTLTASGNGLSITNGDGVSGNPTFALTGLPAALSNLAGGGFLVALDASSIIQRSIAGTANEITVADGNGLNGTPTIGLADNPVLPGTEGVALPSGTTAQRAAVPPNGTIRYNSDLSVLEGYANNTWGSIVVGSGVTSVNVSGGATGLTTSGGPITSTGTITFAGTLITSNGGTGLSSYTAGDIVYYATGTAFSKLAIGTNGQVMTSSGTAPQWTAQSSLSVGSATTATNVAGGATNQIVYNTSGNTSSFIVAPTVANTFLEWSGSAFQWSANPLGTVTSVNVSGGTTGLTTSGGPVTTSGTITLAGTLNVANGGTGRTVGNYSIYANEIHVGKDGNDTTGDGTLINPVLTITKALTLIGAGRNTVVVHPGSYSESPTVSSANTTIATSELTGANTQIAGTLTLSAAARISGIKLTNLTITGSGNAYISNCTVDTQVIKSGSNYVEIINSELQCTLGVQISGAGTVSILGNKCWAVTVSNASANVLIKDCFQVLTPSVTAGTLQIDGSAIFAISPASNAVTSSAGSFVTLANCFVLNSAGNDVERVSLAGFYSILNLVYDKTNSTFAGTNLNAIDYFSVINADTLVLTNDLAIAYGGTNSSATPTAGAIAYGAGTAYAFSAVGNSGDVFTSAGAGAPGWTAQSTLAVGSATNATNTTNVAITDDTSTNATMYPVWVTANTGNLPAKVTSTKLSFNPSTGVLTATGGITGGTF